MRIHSVTIDNFRAIDHLELADLPETGVIVLHGDNEAGKSTILDAIDMVLTKQSTSKKKEVKAIAPVGRDVGPEVTLTATVGDVTFTMYKRWLKGPKAQLKVTAPTRYERSGREAEDELERILGEHLDTNLASTLFLRQGELDTGVQAAGITTVAATLDAQTGSAAAGAEDTALMAAVEEEYSRYYTAGGRQKASLTALSTAVDAAQTAYAEAEAQVAELLGYVDEVERKHQEILQVEAELPGAEQEAEETAAAADKAVKVRDQASQAAERLSQAEISVQRAQQDVEARGVMGERVAAVEKEAALLRDNLAPAREAREAEAAKVAELTARREAARERVAQAREAAKRAGAVRELIRAEAQLAARDELLARVEEAHEAYTELVGAAPVRVVADADIRTLEAAETDLTLQRRLLETSAAKLDITAAGRTVRVDGEDVDVDGTVSVGVFEGTELIFGDVTVVYRAAQGAKDPRAGVEKAQRVLDEALSALQVKSVDEARAVRDAHREHGAELEAARRRLQDLVGDRDVETLRAERAALAAQVEALSGAAAAGGAGGAGAGGELTETEADAAVKEADTGLAEAEREADAAEAALKPYADRKAEAEVAKLETLLGAKEAELAGAQAELAAAEEKAPQAQLAEALAAAKEAAAEAKLDAETLRAQAEEANPDLAEQLAKAAATRVASLAGRRAAAENRVTELKGRIEIAAGAAERADRAEAELEKAVSELERTTRRAEAAKLLHDTMTAHRDAARARYSAPFNEAMRKHASMIYGPSVDFSFGDALEITGRSVGGTEIPVEQLSGGTKEQLAILTRFAIADLVTASGETAPVPVVVDDALGATDPDRLTRMNLLFNQVGQRAQVLVLTCFPQRFDRVDAARRIAIEDVKSGPVV